MTCLVARHARHADLSEPPLVDVCRWDQASTPEGDGPPVVDVGAEEFVEISRCRAPLHLSLIHI